jgi:predicted signal transduction protein with EAL and GGDEF domain
MPDSGPEAAEALVERIHARLAMIPASASIGVATFPQDATSAEGLLEAADRRQREQKARRRAALVA